MLNQQILQALLIINRSQYKKDKNRDKKIIDKQ